MLAWLPSCAAATGTEGRLWRKVALIKDPALQAEGKPVNHQLAKELLVGLVCLACFGALSDIYVCAVSSGWTQQNVLQWTPACSAAADLARWIGTWYGMFQAAADFASWVGFWVGIFQATKTVCGCNCFCN